MASYLDEFNKQQKALKEKERKSKAATADILHHYHGGEHDVKDYEKQQADLRRTLQLRRESAKEKHQNFRGVASLVVDGSSLIEPMLEEEEPNVPPAEAEKGAERIMETQAEALLIAAATAAGPIATSRLADELLQEQTFKLRLEDDSNAATLEKSGMDHGQCLELEYAFGLLYPAREPPPDLATCTKAAADIVPSTFSQPMGKTKVSYNPKFPPIVTSVQKDDAFVSEDDSVRYVVKGRIPVFVDEENKVETASLRNSLKSEVSFRRMVAVTKDDKNDEVTGEVVVGSDEGGKWKKVREGAPVPWENVVKKAGPCQSEEKQP